MSHFISACPVSWETEKRVWMERPGHWPQTYTCTYHTSSPPHHTHITHASHMHAHMHTHTEFLWPAWGPFALYWKLFTQLNFWCQVRDLPYASLCFPIMSFSNYLLNKCTTFIHLKGSKYIMFSLSSLENFSLSRLLKIPFSRLICTHWIFRIFTTLFQTILKFLILIFHSLLCLLIYERLEAIRWEHSPFPPFPIL